MSVALESVLLYEGSVTEPERENHNMAADDAALVARARTGDFAAYEELVRQYRNDVFAVAYHFVRDREEAWDLSQEVFIKAHRALKRFRGDASFKTWVLRITANQCKDFLKKRRLKTVSFDRSPQAMNRPSGELDPAGSAEARELGEAIQEAIDALPVKHRTAFVLREIEGLSYQEMAGVMRCNIGTVMSRLHHARQKLRTLLEQSGFALGTKATKENH
jgi:RNA polymerase sigma-70 factor, ECF subfamily